MRKNIEDAIIYKAGKILKKRRIEEELKAEFRRKFTTRTGLPAKLPPLAAKVAYDPQFDPQKSRSHARSLSWGIWHKALAQAYKPVVAILKRIPKPGSKQKREITVFGVPDSAISNVLNSLLLERNMKRFSANSFAYRPDRNQIDAIINLKKYLNAEKIFVIQFDFKQFFDRIPHWYIYRTLSAKGIISISALERGIVSSFISHRYAPPKSYVVGKYFEKDIGTPQGSSLSLFLANLANDALDKRLENVNGQFVRYADDVVAVANTYEDALKIEGCFHSHCEASGLRINFEKSDGIRLLTKQRIGEIQSINKFKFVGYDFYPSGKCAISDKAIQKIKTKISRLIQIYLIQYPQEFGFSTKRTLPTSTLPFFDWDLMGLLAEIRGYLYGGCSEGQISALIYDGKRIPPMRGLMSFYALVDRKSDLIMLDGWMLNNLRRALHKRQLILKNKYGVNYPRFRNTDIIKGNWYSVKFNDVDFIPDPTLPSFVRGWRAARKYYLTFGLAGAAPPPYSGY